MCVADPVEVSVNLPLSVDVPLPYQVVRGEQVELQGSVYNRLESIITVSSATHWSPSERTENTEGGAPLTVTHSCC